MQDKVLSKIIEVGKFYFVHDGSETGHPGFVVWKNDESNRYLVIRFDSDKHGDITKRDRGVKHITKLKHVISDSVMNSYVRNRPMICKRKDIGHLMTDLSINPEDIKIIEMVSHNPPELAPSLRK